jgi:hypothetical protein
MARNLGGWITSAVVAAVMAAAGCARKRWMASMKTGIRSGTAKVISFWLTFRMVVSAS